MKGYEEYPPILDVPGVANLLGTSVGEVRRLSGEGWLPAVKVSGRWYYRRDEVVQWLASNRIAPPSPDQGDHDESGPPSGV